MYGFALFLYYNFLKLAANFSPKAKLWVEGRRDSEKFLNQNQEHFDIWFHVSSLGEFEQVALVIEKIKKDFTNLKILVTFYSPSGYEKRKDFPFADKIMYLPYDYSQTAHQFINTIQPKLVFWVRYEFWYNMLSAIHQSGATLYLLNGVFYPSYSRFYLPFLRKCLNLFTSIFTINEISQTNLKSIGFISDVLYDTRYDRMYQIAQESFKDAKIEQFIDQNPVIIFGSTWLKDDQMIAELIKKLPNYKFIIAPHDVKNSRINELLSLFPSANVYSQEVETPSQLMIIDTIGLLSRIYRYADIIYVGGGFDKVVHSLVEPLAYYKPILMGPHIDKSLEAEEYAQAKIAFVIHNSEEFIGQLNKINPDLSNIQKQFFLKRIGSVDKILSLVKKKFQL